MESFKKKIPLLIVSFFAFVGLLYAPPAHAWSLFSFGASVISDILYSLILTPLSWVLTWAGSLVNFAIQPGNLPLTAATNTFVQTGWTAMRDLTNMLFILVMLAIALDYILFNSVGVKRALPRLLLVALLINFSLPIAGVVIDFANVFTDFFIKQVGGPQFTEVFAHKLGLVNVFSIDTTAPADSLITINQVEEGALTSTIFSIFFILGTIFVLFALAIMFFIRYFYLSILLIILPLVLVASILPQLGAHYKKWTNKFISWTMFAPAAAFFLYLSMMFLDTQVGTFTATMKSAGWISGFAAQATTFIFAWMLMLASLTTANSMGIAGASVAINTFNKGTKWAQGKAANAGKRAWRETGGRAADAGAKAIAARSTGMVGGFAARQLQRVGVASRVGVEARREAQLKEKYKNYSPEEMNREIQALSKNPLNNAKVSTLMALQAAKGESVELVPGEAGQRESSTIPGLTVNEEEILKRYNSAFVTEADRKRLRKANPGIALHVLNPDAPGLTPQQKQKIQTDRDDYIKELRSSDIENMSPGAINKTLIGEMVRTGSWTEGKFKNLFDRNPQGFSAEFNAFLTPLMSLPRAQQFNNSGPWYPLTPTGNASLDEANAKAAINAAVPGMTLDQWRRLLTYTNSNAATQNLGIVSLPKTA